MRSDAETFQLLQHVGQYLKHCSVTEFVDFELQVIVMASCDQVDYIYINSSRLSGLMIKMIQIQMDGQTQWTTSWLAPSLTAQSHALFYICIHT